MSKHNVKDVEFVTCPYCQEGPENQFKMLHWKHLKIVHSKTLDDVLMEFPDIPTMTLAAVNKTKFAKCCNPNCPTPDEEFEVNINVANSNARCSVCKKNGYVSEMTKNTHKKQIETLQKKYGKSNPSNIDSVVKKRNETVKNKRKEKEYFKKIVTKRTETMVNKYGDDWAKKNNELSRKAMKDKYGVEFALQVNEFKNKSKETYFNKTGYEYPGENPEVKEKIKKINLERHGFHNVMMNKLISKKVSEKIKKSWENDEIRNKRLKSFRDEFMKRFDKYLKFLEIELIDPEFIGAHYKHNWRCKKGHTFKQIWNAIQQGYTCPLCNPRKFKKSKAESEVADFIKGLNFNIICNNRSIIFPYELDIVIEDEKIAIEYHGVFYHTENVISNTRKNIDPKKYHLMKYEMCKEQGYSLIQIFEDEWIFKKRIVQERLKQILNVHNRQRIHARKCIIKEIDSKVKNKFLKKFHIQGRDASVIKIGAFFEDTLISVMTFSKGNISKGSKYVKNVWELNRFCSNYNFHIPGIASKLLKYFKRNYEWKEIFSYADLRWSNGNLYYKLGFDLISITSPNYWYLAKDSIERIHRFSLRKRPNEPKDITEMVLRTKEGYRRIWDCGNLKFRMINN